jgi:hypothetical protein
MKKFLVLLALPVVLFSCSSSDSTAPVSKGTSNDPIKMEIEKFNKCLANDDTAPCLAMIAEDKGSITGTKEVKDVLPKFPPYIRALQEIQWGTGKDMVAEKGEKVYVVVGKAVLKNGDKTIDMYVRYNLVEQDGALKFYGIQFDPNELKAEF